MTTIYHTFKLHLFPKDNKNDIRAFKTNHPLKRRMHTGLNCMFSQGKVYSTLEQISLSDLKKFKVVYHHNV